MAFLFFRMFVTLAYLCEYAVENIGYIHACVFIYSCVSDCVCTSVCVAHGCVYKQNSI